MYPLADGCDIYVIDLVDEDYDSISASRLASKYSGELAAATVYGIYDDDGNVTTMYVVATTFVSD